MVVLQPLLLLVWMDFQQQALTAKEQPFGEAVVRLDLAVNGLCPADLSLLNADNSPPGACPEPGKIVRFDLERDD
jgi:hypothetical protein